MSIHFIQSMLLDITSDAITDTAEDSGLSAGNDGLFDKNLLTTAGVLVAAGGGVAGTALLLSALPGQVIAASAVSGGLLYAGDRQHKGLPIIPNFKSQDAAPVAPAVAVEATPA